MDCLVSDLHLNHWNIIEYCDRPFESVEEMNETLVENWNAVVDADDEVLYGGDLTISYDTADLLDWLDRLNGEVVFLLGNHDETVSETLDGVEFYDHYRFEAEGYRFYAVHDPVDADPSADEWMLHGHHHNNWPDELPFVDPETQRVNFSIELTGYRPLSIDDLIAILDRGERFADREAAT